MRVLVIFTVTVIALLGHKSKGYFKVIEELGCHTTKFQLTCEQNNTNIIIFEASFFLNEFFLKSFNNSCKSLEELPNISSWEKWKKILYAKSNSSKIIHFNIRHALNKRCSGARFCNFVASREAAEVGLGIVFLKYACVHDLYFSKACNSSITVFKEGFVKSPGYPRYYPGDTTCLWILKARFPQRIKVTFMDVSLRNLGPLEEKCLDAVTVSEDGLNLFSTCGDVLEDISVYSDGPSLNVSFKTLSKIIFPKRGFLFHYEVVGCPHLTKPEDGYLVNRNETFAHFRCYVGFVFPDTKSRDKTLKCYNENTWDGNLLNCVNLSKILEKEDLKRNITYNRDLTVEAKFIMETQDSIKDIIIPVIVICILLFGNAIILYFIYRNRKKMSLIDKMETKDLQQHTELKDLQQHTELKDLQQHTELKDLQPHTELKDVQSHT